MRSVDVIVERDTDTGFLVGHVPGWPGAHSQAETFDQLRAESTGNLLDDGESEIEFRFIADR